MNKLQSLDCEATELQSLKYTQSALPADNSSSLQTIATSQETALARSSVINSQLSPWLMPLVYPFGCGIVLPFYFRNIQVLGRENLPTAGPVIFAPTHRARWDCVVVPYAVGKYVTGKHLRFMVSADEVVGLQGWLIRRLGGFPIDTRQPTVSALRYGVELLRQQENLVIFPEGNIFRGQPVQRLRPGLARLALQAEAGQPGLGVQIVPMSLQYDPIFPNWRCQVTVKIGKPLVAANYNEGGIKQQAMNLTQDLTTMLKTLHD